MRRSSSRGLHALLARRETPRVHLREGLAGDAGLRDLAFDAVELAEQFDRLAGSARLAPGKAGGGLHEAASHVRHAGEVRELLRRTSAGVSGCNQAFRFSRSTSAWKAGVRSAIRDSMSRT